MDNGIKELLEFSIINIDKPAGPTSFSVSQFVKEKLGLRKTSHFGTLDPIVTGVLPVALSRACKLNEYFMHKDKTYAGVMRLHSEISADKLKDEMEKFVGKIKQTPPIRSSVKRQEREREIKRFEIVEKEGKDVLFFTEVEAGTYIRKLIHDLGERIGGAHMTELRRTKAGIFSEEDGNFINLYGFEDAVSEYEKGNEKELKRILVPAEEAILKVLPKSDIKGKNIKQILTGKPLMKKDFYKIPAEKKFAIFLKDRFIGVYRKADEGDIIARAEFVFN